MRLTRATIIATICTSLIVGTISISFAAAPALLGEPPKHRLRLESLEP
jgi:hypothetical protein